MISISRFALVAVAVAGIASPALAQSFEPYVGPGASASVQQVKVVHKTHRSVAARQSGLDAFAMTPGGAGSDLSPAATGGGSIGYNDNLRRDSW